MVSGVSPLYEDIANVNPNESMEVSRAIKKAFIRTNCAFKNAMWIKGYGESKKPWNHTDKKEISMWAFPTVIDFPTYKHLPEEFLRFTDGEKTQLIKDLCVQNTTVNDRSSQKWETSRDAYISSLYMDVMNLLQSHLHMKIPDKFAHMHIHSIHELIDFMNTKWFRSDTEKLYHCMLLKSMFLMHTIRATIDLESLPRILTYIRNEIAHHKHIAQVEWDESSGKMKIAYTAPWVNKPQMATITFGEKDIPAIFDKLARKASYTSPELLNDIARMNINFEEDEQDDVARAWLIKELSQITFWGNILEIEMSTKQEHESIVSPEILKSTFGASSIKCMDIPDVHNLQITGKVSNKLPSVRGVQSFELMCTSKDVDWNHAGIGNRSIYKVERLQQAFSRLLTGHYGILKPWQVKYALWEYAQKMGVSESPEELLTLLLKEKKLLIPTNMLHRGSLCYRIKGVSRPETKNLNSLSIEDLDPDNPEVWGRLMREFTKARVTTP